MEFTVNQLIAYIEINKGMVFIDNKYMMVWDLKRYPGNHKFKLKFQNSICSLHF